MPRQWELQIGNALVIPRKNFGDDFPLQALDKYTLRNGISLVVPMLEAALEGLQEVQHPGADSQISKMTGGRIQTQQKVLEVYDALAKYFNLTPTDPRFARNIEGLIAVYNKIKSGLSSNYEIVIFHPANKKRGKSLTNTVGFVAPKRGAEVDVRAVGPIRDQFGFVDEFNHDLWEGYDVEGKGKIHLSFAYVNSHMPNREEQVARTIIHEASHKFAGTTDVLYKSQSFSKMGLSDEDLANLQWQQPGGTRAAGAYVGKAKQEKPLRLLAGADNSGHQIDSVRFLENADSYAWTARRLWKRFRKFRY